MSETRGAAQTVIGPYRPIKYRDAADAFRPYDPRLPQVASRVVDLIRQRLPGTAVEHIGSSAIPGCDGKGVVDLMVLFEPGGLDATRRALEALGLRRYVGPKAHPEARPVLVGSTEYDGETFRLHVHVISAGAPEVADQLHFRDTLRRRPGLVAEYVAVKRHAVEEGVSDSVAYNDRKDAFIKRVMALRR